LEADYRLAARQALKKILETRMHNTIDACLQVYRQKNFNNDKIKVEVNENGS